MNTSNKKISGGLASAIGNRSQTLSSQIFILNTDLEYTGFLQHIHEDCEVWEKNNLHLIQYKSTTKLSGKITIREVANWIYSYSNQREMFDYINNSFNQITTWTFVVNRKIGGEEDSVKIKNKLLDIKVNECDILNKECTKIIITKDERKKLYDKMVNMIVFSVIHAPKLLDLRKIINSSKFVLDNNIPNTALGNLRDKMANIFDSNLDFSNEISMNFIDPHDFHRKNKKDINNFGRYEVEWLLKNDKSNISKTSNDFIYDVIEQIGYFETMALLKTKDLSFLDKTLYDSSIDKDEFMEVRKEYGNK